MKSHTAHYIVLFSQNLFLPTIIREKKVSLALIILEHILCAGDAFRFGKHERTNKSALRYLMKYALSEKISLPRRITSNPRQ